LAATVAACIVWLLLLVLLLVLPTIYDSALAYIENQVSDF
jgi:hypothetical protein